ncbi:DUF2544 domain-containing protein [Escherichia coli]|nr:DUF2544 domain-containing protein [Escherichia coli]QML57116.1 DUF2544 domain-containing protein [Escherichia coli]WFW63441.1 YfcO family protein [Escherichia coli]
MKTMHYVIYALLLMCINTDTLAAKKIAELYVPMGYSSYTTEIQFYLKILTPEGVEYGVYKQHSAVLKNENLDLVSWSGSSIAPILKLARVTNLPKSVCPGLDEFDARSDRSDWICEEATLEVYTDEDLHGCPWLVSSYIESSQSRDDTGIYAGPNKVSSVCPGVPLDPYDISWNENYVVHDKVLQLKSTGSTIETSLSTFLMKDGKLCNGSQYDERGAYCRWVSEMITFTFSGCDDAKVTVTPTRHPVTDKQLHDMLVRVDTTSQQPLESTCRFQYILNML